MGIGFRASSAAGAESSAPAPSQALTIPAAVQAGDVILLVISALVPLSVPSTVTVTSTGTAPVLASGPVSAVNSGFTVNAAVYSVVATAADAGAVITASCPDDPYWALGMAAWSGCSPGGPVDVAPAGTAEAGTASIACPAASTVTAGDWAACLLAAVSENGTPVIPAGTTSRLSSYGGTNVGTSIADGNAPAGGAGTGIGGADFTAPGASTWWAAFTIGLRPAGEFEPFYAATDGNGVQTWGVSYSGNQPATYPLAGTADCTGLRVLPPSSPSGTYDHGIVHTLPVNTGYADATFGNGLDVIRGLGAQDAYNLTVIEPSFGISPWYADNPGDPTQLLETFMTLLRGWAQSQFGSGSEKHYLLGFSKSGIGGAGLLYKHPALWYAAGLWDAPFMMTDYDGTDAAYGGDVGGDPAFNYGTSASFKAGYELSTANITAWNAAASEEFTTSRRLWIGGWFAFEADVSAYMAELTGLGVEFDGTWFTADASHAWHPGWVGAALASIVALPSAGADDTWTVAIASGHRDVVLPDGLPYQGGDSGIILPAAGQAQLSASAPVTASSLGGTASYSVVVRDGLANVMMPFGPLLQGGQSATLADWQYGLISAEASAALFSSVTPAIS